ncbi:MAG: HAD family phosphatase [Erysipelotrichales bacterium]|nr:HAD family phosphatase [Erysipelotrichales bacterium]
MKILCSDFDGTLAVADIISKDTLEAIKDFQKAGNLFGVVTGRRLKSLEPMLERYGVHPDFLVLSNGALIIKNDKHTINGRIEKEVTERIVHIASKHLIDSVTISDGVHHEVQNTKTRLSLGAFVFKVGGALFSKSSKVDPNNVVAVYLKDFDKHRCSKVSEEIVSELGDCVELKINAGINVDITAHNITKENAIYKLKDEFPDAMIYTVGDSLNDVGMIKAFYGYAMKNGNDAVKQVAKKQVKSVAEAIRDIMEDKHEGII